MRKLYIQEISESSLNAGSKARNDCDIILSELGYQPILFYRSEDSRKRKRQNWQNPLKLACRILTSSCCVLQYPYYLLKHPEYDYKTMLRFYHGRLECIIHDIKGLRNGSGTIEDELCYILQKADAIYVHTPKMKEILIKRANIQASKIKVLFLFDYLTDSAVQTNNPHGKDIIFAGNLNKSPFIGSLDKIPGNINFNLYGAFSDYIKESRNCRYLGKFFPDDISSITGSWGLAWDGNSLDTCNGPAGEYLRINSSHKISLYLAAGKPVIIWEESALKDFIVQNHLGITVKSIYEIETKIDALSNDELNIICKNVSEISLKIRSGYFLKKGLSGINLQEQAPFPTPSGA